MTLQNNYNPTIQLFVRVGKKNGKPAVLVSKWLTDPLAIEEVVRRAQNNENLNAIITITDKIKFYGSLAEQDLIKYSLEDDQYYFNTGDIK